MQPDARSLVNALPLGALIIDGSGIITVCNAAAHDILQATCEGVQATAIIRNPAFSAALAQMKSAHHAVTVDLETYGKPPRQVSAHVSRIASNDHVLVVFHDLTREQAIEKMRSDFVANASHEMRTPLTSIMGAIETLQGAAKNDAKARDSFLASMLMQARRMKHLVDDLLTLSRIELNEHVKPNDRVSLAAVARQARNNLQALAHDMKVDVQLSEANEAVVGGDADELLQVALNLMENAIKYGQSGGRVEVVCASTATHATFSVRDYGTGIAEIHLPRLTERFYRVNTRESRALGGTGLGLAIVKHIVSRHRGQLRIASSPGQGSTFVVTIPNYKT
jgi:two-component system, OmpR family, phosphate regulon sensor histidine kinase PhoR